MKRAEAAASTGLASHGLPKAGRLAEAGCIAAEAGYMTGKVGNSSPGAKGTIWHGGYSMTW